MLKFDFIDTLFDKRQYEKFAISIFEKFYFKENDETDSFSVWFETATGGSIKTTPLNFSYFEFCSDKLECQSALKNQIQDNLYYEKIRTRDNLQILFLNDDTLAKRVKDQALHNLDLLISKFNTCAWLDDKEFIIEDIKSIRQIINSTHLEGKPQERPQPIAGCKNKSLENRLTDTQIQKIFTLTKAINLFSEPFEFDDLKSFFCCINNRPLKITSNKHFAWLLNYLQPNFIHPNWQSIIEHNKSIRGARGSYVTAKNLSASLNNVNP